MEVKIQDEIAHLVKEIRAAMKRDSVNIHDLITPSVSNNVCILAFGQRYDYDDPSRRLLDEALNTIPRLLEFSGIVAIAPKLTKVLSTFRIGRFGKLRYYFDRVEEFCQNVVKDHRKSLDADNPRDYIDSYLIEHDQRKKNGNIASFDENRVVSTVRGFFGAGSETVRTTTDWAMLLMAKHQDVQQKIQQELDTVVGLDRQVAWSDRTNMPYSTAVVLELQRWASVVPSNLPRKANADCVVAGHTIPKGTTVFINLWSVHHDPTAYPEPENFDPNRFLDSSKSSVVKREDLIPFSAGESILELFRTKEVDFDDDQRKT